MEGNLIRILFGKLLDALRFDKPRLRSEEADPEAARRRERFTVQCDGIDIKGQILFPSAHPSRQYPALIICHGIPGSGAQRPPNDPGYEGLSSHFSDLGLATVIFNFRGCGDSGGNFDMLGWVRDLEAVVDMVLNTPYIDPTRLMILGFSGGGAAAIRAAADSDKVFSLAVVGTPAHFKLFEADPDEILSDFRERGLIKDKDFPRNVDAWLRGFDEIEPRRWIAYFKGKHLLVVHGDADELIPVEHAREIVDHAPAGISEIAVIPGGVHRLRLDPRCIEIVSDWFLKTLGVQR
ncbi:MAG: alpha/beta fold hydrolase [Desulfomonilaceae bacterium]|nr:alpha/beta fold hydrolase [Desulfomonilaceae bacterium]